MWTQSNSKRWVRNDGAVVKWDDASPWPNPIKASARMWTAWEPDPSQRALSMERGRWRKGIGLLSRSRWKPIFPRRWKTPKAAMAAVDREYPMEQSK